MNRTDRHRRARSRVTGSLGAILLRSGAAPQADAAIVDLPLP